MVKRLHFVRDYRSQKNLPEDSSVSSTGKNSSTVVETTELL